MRDVEVCAHVAVAVSYDGGRVCAEAAARGVRGQASRVAQCGGGARPGQGRQGPRPQAEPPRQGRAGRRSGGQRGIQRSQVRRCKAEFRVHRRARVSRFSLSDCCVLMMSDSSPPGHLCCSRWQPSVLLHGCGTFSTSVHCVIVGVKSTVLSIETIEVWGINQKLSKIMMRCHFYNTSIPVCHWH